jgi:hypothetical protein
MPPKSKQPKKGSNPKQPKKGSNPKQPKKGSNPKQPKKGSKSNQGSQGPKPTNISLAGMRKVGRARPPPRTDQSTKKTPTHEELTARNRQDDNDAKVKKNNEFNKYLKRLYFLEEKHNLTPQERRELNGFHNSDKFWKHSQRAKDAATKMASIDLENVLEICAQHEQNKRSFGSIRNEIFDMNPTDEKKMYSGRESEFHVFLAKYFPLIQRCEPHKTFPVILKMLWENPTMAVEKFMASLRWIGGYFLELVSNSRGCKRVFFFESASGRMDGKQGDMFFLFCVAFISLSECTHPRMTRLLEMIWVVKDRVPSKIHADSETKVYYVLHDALHIFDRLKRVLDVFRCLGTHMNNDLASVVANYLLQEWCRQV